LRGLAYYFAKTSLNLARILFRARGHRLARFKALFSGLFAGLSFRPKPASPPVSAQSGPDAPATRCG
ncbi:MAG: hypothetical protein IJG13_01170, partial [Kiritimatiellae bacterium]|nr:hypothetical protein [Kiritimatiellia bacterium]